MAARITATANSAVGTEAVRSVRVLPPGAPPAPRMAPDTPVAERNAPAVPVKTRETGSAGFHQALAAHQAAVPPAAPTRRSRGRWSDGRRRCELSRRAFPEPKQAADNQPALMEQARLQRRRQAAATEAAALRRARAEKAGRTVAAPRCLERTA
ncbi:hypothetical protein AB0M23_21765 [Streptomyces sp. NPDC052077]|uniref:hypothetical protein n=1 Tax=Streptomyces sp. NPDC052077 TaxID=3154757 RepID=UPI00343DE21B